MIDNNSIKGELHHVNLIIAKGDLMNIISSNGAKINNYIN
jgi:ABC-type siderophore export system fused ATPase/permease subunit